jgi:hypothetical protein
MGQVVRVRYSSIAAGKCHRGGCRCYGSPKSIPFVWLSVYNGIGRGASFGAEHLVTFLTAERGLAVMRSRVVPSICHEVDLVAPVMEL